MSGPIYTSFKKVAAGGMAELHLGVAEHASGFKKIVAIKKILPAHSGKQNYIAFMKAEARIGATLQHAAIVNVHGFDRVEGSDALIMEYVQGVDLETLLKKCRKGALPLSKPMALYIASEVARALAFVHGVRDQMTNREMTIIHADVTPSNILVSFEGEVKLSDFGIACARLQGDVELPDGLRGKPSYMAPEQARSQRISPSTDVFSLGCVLFEMISGRRLFDADLANPNRFDILAPGRLDEVLAKAIEAIDGTLKEILSRCLALDPAQRFQKTSDLEAALVDALQSHYGSFTRQRLSTFLKSVFARDIRQLNETISQALNAKTEYTALAHSADEVLAEAAGGNSPPQPTQSKKLSSPPDAGSLIPDAENSASAGAATTTNGDQFKLHRGRDITNAEHGFSHSILPHKSPQRDRAAVSLPVQRMTPDMRATPTMRQRPQRSVTHRTIAEPAKISKSRTSPLVVVFFVLLVVTVGAVGYTLMNSGGNSGALPGDGRASGLSAKSLKRQAPQPAPKPSEEK